MDLGRAESVYVGVLFAMFACAIWAGVVDIYLIASDQPSITSFLRHKPYWFLWPLVITQVFLAALTIHVLLVE